MWVLGVGLVALGLMACERDELLSVVPEEAPGQSAPTLESLLGPGDVPRWIDTVFSGFIGPSQAGFLQVEEGTGQLISRGLIRYENIQDSVFVADTVSGVLRFDSARVVFTLDTTRSVLASTGTTVQLRSVAQSWDAGSATWEFAVDSPGVREPWTGGPGGTLGGVLTELTVTELTDSLVFELGAISDSILSAWSDTTQLNDGVAVVVGDSGRVVLQTPRLLYEAVPELQPDTAFSLRVFANTGTFILDLSSQTPAVGVLRLGGLEGWRSFVELVLPDSVPLRDAAGRARLRGATINKAELVLVSLPPPPGPFAAEDSFPGTAFELADDFQVYGAKTPVGDRIVGSLFTLDPAELEAGTLFALDLTQRVQAWANVPVDSTPLPLRFTVRARPEGTTFGFWEFGAADGEVAFQPLLRLVFTPPVEFATP